MTKKAGRIAKRFETAWGRMVVTFTFPALRRLLARMIAIVGLLSLIVGPVSIGASAAVGPQRFDGDWAIYIYGEPGSCAFGYRLPITISDGNVLYKGRLVHPSVIGVSSAGAVAIHLGGGRTTVTGSGAINTEHGWGHWSAPWFRCTGWWRAEKR